MTDADIVHELENMALFSFSGDTVVLPIEQATAIMVLLKKARRYDYNYASGEKTHHIGGTMPRVVVEFMSSEDYTEGLINGPRKMA